MTLTDDNVRDLNACINKIQLKLNLLASKAYYKTLHCEMQSLMGSNGAFNKTVKAIDVNIREHLSYCILLKKINQSVKDSIPEFEDSVELSRCLNATADRLNYPDPSSLLDFAKRAREQCPTCETFIEQLTPELQFLDLVQDVNRSMLTIDECQMLANIVGPIASKSCDSAISLLQLGILDESLVLSYNRMLNFVEGTQVCQLDSLLAKCKIPKFPFENFITDIRAKKAKAMSILQGWKEYDGNRVLFDEIAISRKSITRVMDCIEQNMQSLDNCVKNAKVRAFLTLAKEILSDADHGILILFKTTTEMISKLQSIQNSDPGELEAEKSSYNRLVPQLRFIQAEIDTCLRLEDAYFDTALEGIQECRAMLQKYNIKDEAASRAIHRISEGLQRLTVICSRKMIINKKHTFIKEVQSLIEQLPEILSEVQQSNAVLKLSSSRADKEEGDDKSDNRTLDSAETYATATTHISIDKTASEYSKESWIDADEEDDIIRETAAYTGKKALIRRTYGSSGSLSSLGTWYGLNPSDSEDEGSLDSGSTIGYTSVQELDIETILTQKNQDDDETTKKLISTSFNKLSSKSEATGSDVSGGEDDVKTGARVPTDAIEVFVATPIVPTPTSCANAKHIQSHHRDRSESYGKVSHPRTVAVHSQINKPDCVVLGRRVTRVNFAGATEGSLNPQTQKRWQCEAYPKFRYLDLITRVSLYTISAYIMSVGWAQRVFLERILVMSLGGVLYGASLAIGISARADEMKTEV